jgi:hypothetical protein
MHRSGTSATTRVIDLLGVPVARHGLLPEDDFNPAGYWEVAPLMRLNEHLLGRLGGSWRSPPPLENLAAADRLLGDGRDAAEREFRAFHPGPQWVWKDPRNCLLLGFWRKALAEPVVVVYVHRAPDEVIASLHGYGLTAPAAAALWERYVRSARLLACDVPSIVVDYGRLAESPEETVEKLAAFLGSHGAQLDPAGAPRAAGSVQGELRRRRSGSGGLTARSRLSREQSAMASMLSDAAKEGAPLSVVSPRAETRATWRLLSATPG